MIDRATRALRIVADSRKKITIGYKGKDGLPKKANHFVVKHPETKEVYFPELEVLYGEKPVEFIVSFPTDKLTDFYNDDFSLWAKTGIKKRKCDGVECVHIIEETIEGTKFTAGEVTSCSCELFGLKAEDATREQKNIACKCDVYLKCYILNPETLLPISPMCYLFANHGVNSADNIYSELSRYNKFLGYPFRLTVKEVKKAGGIQFNLLELRPYITSELLIEYNLKATTELKHIVGYKEPDKVLALIESPIADATFEEIPENEVKLTVMKPEVKKRFLKKLYELRTGNEKEVDRFLDDEEIRDVNNINDAETAKWLVEAVTDIVAKQNT